MTFEDRTLAYLGRIERRLITLAATIATLELTMSVTAQEIIDELTETGAKIDNAREAFAAQLKALADRLDQMAQAGDLDAIKAAVDQVRTDAYELAAAAVEGTPAESPNP